MLGGGPGHKATRVTQKRVGRWIAQLWSSVSPRIVFSIFSVRSVGGGVVRLANGMTLQGAKLSRAVSKSKYLVCFVGTVGKAIDDLIADLMEKGKVSDAFVVDALGSVCVEAMVERFHQGTDQHARALGYGSTLRFAPGYCDWSLREQITLFRLVDAKSIGISLSPSALMTPRKSVSGVFGLAAGLSAVQTPYNPCVSCGKKDCFSRRLTA